MTGKPLILCVDDSSNVLEGRKMLLEENGFEVLTATKGREGKRLSRIRSIWCFSTITCRK